MPERSKAKNKYIAINGVELTPREWSVAKLIAAGLNNKQIAGELGLAEGSIKVYTSRMYQWMVREHPEIRQQDFRMILGQWVRCHLCKAGDLPSDPKSV